MKLVNIVSLLAVTVLGEAHARSLVEVKAAGTLIIGTNAEFKPFTYYFGNQMKGFEYDLGNAIAKELGVRAAWVNRPFDPLLDELNQDRFDLVISSHAITAARKKLVDFSNPHYCSGGMIVTKPGGPSSVKALKGKTVAVQDGTTYVTETKKAFGPKSVRTFAKNDEALAALITGKVDAMVNEKFYSIEALKVHRSRLQQGEMLFQEELGMAVKKGNTSLRTAVNDALAKLQANGTYAKLSTSYFDQEVRCK